MRAADGVTFSNIATTTDPFHLEGGRYAFIATGTFASSPNVELQMLSPDGTTYVSLFKAFNNAGTEADLIIGKLGAAGMKTLDLPPGIYKIVVANVTALYVGIYRVPGE